MKINTFWNLLIKILGIWLILDGFYLLPEYISGIIMTLSGTFGSDFFVAFAGLFLVLIIYYLILRFFVFHSNWIIKKLRLNENFEGDYIEFKGERSTIITISLIVISGIMFVDSLPTLANKIFIFFQTKAVLNENPETSWVIFYFIKALVSYLMMTNAKKITTFILKNISDPEEKTIE